METYPGTVGGLASRAQNRPELGSFLGPGCLGLAAVFPGNHPLSEDERRPGREALRRAEKPLADQVRGLRRWEEPGQTLES
jgi:hypothetical protein